MRASFQMAHLLAKLGKSFISGKLVEIYMLQTVKELFPDKSGCIHAISLPNRVAYSLKDIFNNTVFKLT